MSRLDNAKQIGPAAKRPLQGQFAKWFQTNSCTLKRKAFKTLLCISIGELYLDQRMVLCQAKWFNLRALTLFTPTIEGYIEKLIRFLCGDKPKSLLFWECGRFFWVLARWNHFPHVPNLTFSPKLEFPDECVGPAHGYSVLCQIWRSHANMFPLSHIGQPQPLLLFSVHLQLSWAVAVSDDYT